MSHSHLVVQHLLKQMEGWRPRQKKRDLRPDWLTALIEEFAESFEPISDVARVGFECIPDGEVWVVHMYLGRTEIVGGPRDGHAQHMSFELNIQGLIGRFERLDEFSWSVFPEGADEVNDPRSYLTLGGHVMGHAVRFHFFATAPNENGPGMRVYSDGRFEPA